MMGDQSGFDIVIVGGGAAGCVLAARLSEDRNRRIALVEAGPDYGPFHGDPREPAGDASAWPADLLDSVADATHSHDWGYDGRPSSARARVIGGCSAHNGCMMLWGSRPDYDEWAEATGDPGWSLDGLRPHLERATATMRVHLSRRYALPPIARAFIRGAIESGLAPVSDYNDPATLEGVGLVPINTRGRTRWNAAFAYLDPVRGRPNLTVVDRTLVDRVVFDDHRATGVVAVRDDAPIVLSASTIVLAAGAYGTPAILQRSGVGPAADLRRFGIPVFADRAGVGAGLLDHPYIRVSFFARPSLDGANQRHLTRTSLGSYAQVKGRSSVCVAGSWDYTIPPWSGGLYDQQTRTTADEIGMNPIGMKTVSRGSVRLRSTRPDVSPSIDHGYLSDPEGHDLAVMHDAVTFTRLLGQTRAWRTWSAGEKSPGPTIGGGADLDAWIRANAAGTYHPCGTCRMGRSSDDAAVVDARGHVHGIDGLRIADASIMPTIPAANIHASVLAIAERLAAEWED